MRKPIRMLLSGIIALTILVVAARLALVFYQGDSHAQGASKVDGVMQLADCPDTPNCVSSQASDTDRQVAPLTYSIDQGAVIPALSTWLNENSRARVVSGSDTYLHATFTTPLMGFIDDVEFLVQANGTLQVRSASRLGQSDLGTNRKRIDTLRESLTPRLNGNNS